MPTFKGRGKTGTRKVEPDATIHFIDGKRQEDPANVFRSNPETHTYTVREVRRYEIHHESASSKWSFFGGQPLCTLDTLEEAKRIAAALAASHNEPTP